jgi:hypothetical protein
MMNDLDEKIGKVENVPAPEVPSVEVKLSPITSKHQRY